MNKLLNVLGCFYIMFAMLSGMMVLPASALVDSRYDCWEDTGYEITGDWDSWQPRLSHPTHEWYEWTNNYPDARNIKAGCWRTMFTFTATETNLRCTPYGRFRFKVFVQKGSVKEGIQLCIFTSAYTDYAQVHLEWLDNTDIYAYNYSVNLMDYLIGVEFTTNIEPEPPLTDKWFFYAYRIYKINKETQQATKLTQLYNYFEIAVDPAKLEYVEHVDCFFGSMGSTKRFEVTCTNWQVGHFADVVNNDWSVNLYDVLAVTPYYGDERGFGEGQIPPDEWYWGVGDRWRADITADGKINIFDVVVVQSAYGQY